ncbi:MAG TPA: glycosyltransferase family 39 protein [Candidatus Lustribacter sp.]|nr:glycosyltransferase family 39 protein [Candidatus Lustribacter sp.]
MIAAAAVVAVLTVLRAYAAFNVPLTPDEAYYWTWSLHPAFGYTDHPPLVAWLIWLGTRFGHNPGFVRLPFVLCEALAALALGRAAALLANSARAGAIAALLFALIPQTKLALGEALPDGAFMAAWACALWGAAALDRRPSLRAAAGLGVALAAAVLARDFGWALVAGIGAWSLAPARRVRLWPLLAATAAIVAVVYAPFVAWNAQHGWEHVVFSFHTREHFGARAIDPSTIRFVAYAIVLAGLTWPVALRRAPRVTLVAWTALPLPAVLLAFSFVTTTESYWIIGPAASLALGAGIVLDRVAPVWPRVAIGVLAAGTAYATAATLFLTLPEAAQASAFAAWPALRPLLASNVYEFAPLALRAQTLAAGDHGADILTDRYETSAELLWYGVDSQIAVPLPQQAQWSRWHAGGGPPPQHALLITFAAPLDPVSQAVHDLDAQFGRATPLPPITSSHAGVPEDVYYVVELGARKT